MKVENPTMLIGKEVYDSYGNNIGRIDKTWKSWNEDYPGWFFGVRPNQETKDNWFRGTHKLFPIYSDYVRDFAEHVNLNKSVDQLARLWWKPIHLGTKTYPTDDLIEKPVYDRNHSRVGTFFGWVETDGNYQHYGCFLDPYLCDTWQFPYNTLMPMSTEYIQDVSDTITLNRTLDEMRDWWRQYVHY